jgi:DNA-binding response OmpR family regulator
MKESKVVPFALIADGDFDLVSQLVGHFANSNFSAVGASTLSDVDRILTEHFVDLLIASTDIDGCSTVDFLEKRQRRGIRVPVVFIVDSCSQIDRMRALEIGDDVVRKPIVIRELIVRARAVLRRFATESGWKIAKNISAESDPFQFCGATVCKKDSLVTFPSGNGAVVGKKEIGLMAILAAAKGSVVTRKDIILSVWGFHADINSRSLDQYVVRIRRLFRKNNCMAIDSLRTIHGVGYLYSARGCDGWQLGETELKSPSPRLRR